MLSVAKMDSFPNLQAQSDATQLTTQAEQAVAELRKWTKHHQEIIDEHEKYAADIVKASEEASKNRAFSESVRSSKSSSLLCIVTTLTRRLEARRLRVSLISYSGSSTWSPEQLTRSNVNRSTVRSVSILTTTP